MPASKRRTSGGPTAASRAKAKSQSTLAFHGRTNKVTKPGISPANKIKKDPAQVEDSIEPETAELVKEEVVEQEGPEVEEEPTTAELSIAEQAHAAVEAPIDPEDIEARALKEAQIKKYWREKENARKAPRVHQEGLSLHEKVCREFDTDGRYGPCVGIARIKRWKRAQNLGLKPPIEVLACLLQEQDAGNVKAQRAHVDELLSSRFMET